MTGIAKLRNNIQEYPWGSHTALAGLLGLPSPSDRPQAELWMGAHPKAPSVVLGPDGECSLAQLIARDPQAMLGPAVAGRFGGRLPFLFKVLAAEQPLSIQAHPGLEQARQGHADENSRGVAPDSPVRNYVDDNHKPEIICALSKFHALSGFRVPQEIREVLAAFDMRPVLELVDRVGLESGTLAPLWSGLQALPLAEKRLIVARLAQAAARQQTVMAEADWVIRALRAHPGDFGALSVLLLNLIELSPGEALYQPPGVLHAYLQGMGMELMANSDNVLRGGLTTKHVDSAELLRVGDFGSAPPLRVSPRREPDGEDAYVTAAAEFRLSRLSLRGRWAPRQRSSIDVWIVTEGACAVGSLSLGTGESFVVPWSAGSYTISGTAVLFRATVPPLS